MKTKFLRKTMLLAAAMIAMGGSNVWAESTIVPLSTANLTELPVAKGEGTNADNGYGVLTGCRFETSNIGYMTGAPATATYHISTSAAGKFYPSVNVSNFYSTTTISLKITNGGTPVYEKEVSASATGIYDFPIADLPQSSDMTVVYTFTKTGSEASEYLLNVKELSFNLVTVIGSATETTLPSSATTVGNYNNYGICNGSCAFGTTEMYNIKNGGNVVFHATNATEQWLVPTFETSYWKKASAVTLTITDGDEEIVSQTVSVSSSSTYMMDAVKLPVSNDLRIKYTFTSEQSDYVFNFNNIKFTNKYMTTLNASGVTTLPTTIASSGRDNEYGICNNQCQFEASSSAVASVYTGATATFQIVNDGDECLCIPSFKASWFRSNTIVTLTISQNDTPIYTQNSEAVTAIDQVKLMPKVTIPAHSAVKVVYALNPVSTTSEYLINIKELNFTSYDYLVSQAVKVSETTLTHAQATTSEANSGEIKHKKAAAYFNNPSSGFTATYDLYFPTNQTYTVSGELASDNTTDQHNLTYTFTSKESVFAEKTFTKENISVSGWDNWTKYTSDLELEGLVTLTITYTKVGSSASNKANFTAPTFTPASYVSYTIPASGLGTYCSAQKLDFSEVKTSDDEAVKPYVILSGAISDNNITATKVEGVVPAATGIIVKGKGGETVSIPVSTETEASLSGTNLLHGVLTATEVDATSGGSYYVVSGGKLTKVDTKGTINPNRAYLQISATSRELSLSFDDDSETTGVEEFKNSNMKELKSYYNLSGQRVAQPTKGLYIVNGKKVVVK